MKGGPTRFEVKEIHQWLEWGYMCGSKVPGDKFYVQGKLFCGDYFESRYYNHLGGKKANNIIKCVRLVTGNICAILYSFQDVLSYAEIKMIRNIGENNPLLMCRYCFNKNMKTPTLGSSGKSQDKQGKGGGRKFE